MIWIILAFGANFISSWIRIQETNLMRIHTDLDPKHCQLHSTLGGERQGRELFPHCGIQSTEHVKMDKRNGVPVPVVIFFLFSFVFPHWLHVQEATTTLGSVGYVRCTVPAWKLDECANSHFIKVIFCVRKGQSGNISLDYGEKIKI
jgi:hypothetical protein